MKVFLVEDNRVLAKSLVRGLKQEGFLVEHFMRGDDGERFFLINHKNRKKKIFVKFFFFFQKKKKKFF